MATKKEGAAPAAPAAPAETAQAAPETGKHPPELPAPVRLRVTARAERRCRAGLCFGGEPVEVDIDPARAALLEADPLLTVERL